MLLRFSVSNWMSFRDQVTLDMVATREEQHREHIATITEHNLKLLPVAAIYGANASGKSNLVKALRFAEQFATSPPKPGSPIPVRPFRLSKEAVERPTSFRFCVYSEGAVFDYAFAVTGTKVVSEELRQVNRTNEKLLFRRTNGVLDPEDQFPENSALRFAFHGTQDNQLFLTNSVSQKLDDFRPLYDWFAIALTIVDPDTRFGGLLELIHEQSPRSAQLAQRLRDLDSGISCLREEDVPIERPALRDYIEEIAKTLREGFSIPVDMFGDEEGLFLQIENGKPITRRVTPIHQMETGEEVTFSVGEESDGTRRLLDLLPAFLLLEGSPFPPVFVIDELDRSLHSLLTRDLLGHLLTNREPSSRSQLIFTTHDTQLMTQDLFRRDEIWITERDRSGTSKLVAFSEFKDVRKDKDIRKSYLQGRMGGVPKIRSLSEPCRDGVEAR